MPTRLGDNAGSGLSARDSNAKPTGYWGHTLFVSRQPGATEWAAEEHIPVDEFVKHPDMERINRGDTVIGTLPIQFIARLCELGAGYWLLNLDMPSAMRGRELYGNDIRARYAPLEGFAGRRAH